MFNELISGLVIQTLRVSILIAILLVIRRFGRLSPRVRCWLWGLIPLVLILPGWLNVPLPKMPERQVISNVSISASISAQSTESPLEMPSEMLTDADLPTESIIGEAATITDSDFSSRKENFSKIHSNQLFRPFKNENASSDLLESSDAFLSPTVSTPLNVASSVSDNADVPKTIETSSVSALDDVPNDVFSVPVTFFWELVWEGVEFFQLHAGIIFLSWLAGFFVLLAYLIKNAIRCRHSLQRAIPVEEPEMLAAYIDACRTMRVDPNRFSAPMWSVSVVCPAIVGFLRP